MEQESWGNRELSRRQGQQHRRIFPMVLVLFTLVSGIIVAGVVRFAMTPKPPERSLQMQAIQVFLNRELGVTDEVRTRFSPEEETDIQSLGDHRYQVNGWVQYLAPDGRSLLYYYTSVIRETPRGDYVKERLALFPQEPLVP